MRQTNSAPKPGAPGTLFLASVSDAREAALALACGADIVDLKDPARGALGAVPADQALEALNAVRGRVPVSMTIGDAPLEPQSLETALAAAAALSPSYIKIGLFDGDLPACEGMLRSFAARGSRLVAVFLADRLKADAAGAAAVSALLERLAAIGFCGAMADTAAKGSGGLRAHWPDEFCAFFLEEARRRSLFAGLAGSLTLSDIAPLLALRPDLLGFRGALCAAGRTSALDPRRVEAVRGAIPQYDYRQRMSWLGSRR